MHQQRDDGFGILNFASFEHFQRIRPTDNKVLDLFIWLAGVVSGRGEDTSGAAEPVASEGKES